MLSTHAYRTKASMDGPFRNSSYSDNTMNQIFHALPNLNLSYVGSSDSIDSGFGSFGSPNYASYEAPKESRWARMDVKLLHQDFKKFLRKDMSINRAKSTVDCVRKASSLSFCKKRVSWYNDINSDDEEEATRKFKQLMFQNWS